MARIIRRDRFRPLNPTLRRATFRVVERIIDDDSHEWLVGLQDSITGGSDHELLVTRCPACDHEIGEFASVSVTCWGCRAEIEVPIAVRAAARHVRDIIADGNARRQENMLRTHGWQGGGTALGIPDC